MTTRSTPLYWFLNVAYCREVSRLQRLHGYIKLGHYEYLHVLDHRCRAEFWRQLRHVHSEKPALAQLRS